MGLSRGSQVVNPLSHGQRIEWTGIATVTATLLEQSVEKSWDGKSPRTPRADRQTDPPGKAWGRGGDAAAGPPGTLRSTLPDI